MLRVENGSSTRQRETAELTGGDLELNHRQRVKEEKMRREAGFTSTPSNQVNRRRIPVWKVTAKSDSEAEILLYDEIAGFNDENWGFINAKGLISKIKALGNIQNITLRINSVGGDVFEAQAMYSYLKSHPTNITVRVDGLAASAASLVAMAGNKVIMPSNALMMIHNPAGGVWGEAEDMRDTAEILAKIRDTIANVYEIIAMAVKGGTIFCNGFGFSRIDEILSAKFPKNAVKINIPPREKDEAKGHKPKCGDKERSRTREGISRNCCRNQEHSQ